MADKGANVELDFSTGVSLDSESTHYLRCLLTEYERYRLRIENYGGALLNNEGDAEFQKEKASNARFFVILAVDDLVQSLQEKKLVDPLQEGE